MAKAINFNTITAKLKAFYARSKRLPSFSEFQNLFGYRSKGGVSRLIPHLIERGIVKQDPTGRLLPTAIVMGGIKLLGIPLGSSPI